MSTPKNVVWESAPRTFPLLREILYLPPGSQYVVQDKILFQQMLFNDKKLFENVVAFEMLLISTYLYENRSCHKSGGKSKTCSRIFVLKQMSNT